MNSVELEALEWGLIGSLESELLALLKIDVGGVGDMVGQDASFDVRLLRPAIPAELNTAELVVLSQFRPTKEKFLPTSYLTRNL